MSTDPTRRAAGAAHALEAEWARGRVPDVEGYWRRFSPGRSVAVLVALVKADLHGRFRRGGRPDVAGYLGRFPALRAARDRVVSLVYEEYCLREERGEAPDPDSFCARYPEWRDSLVSQLRYHRLLSQVVSLPASPPHYPRLGDRFGTFRLRSILGEGGSARVFLAVDETLGDRQVALKISSDRGEEPQIQGRLNHPHIVPVHASIKDPATGLRGLSMPYRAGLPLDEVIRRIDPASRPQGASALREVIPRVEDPGADPAELAGWAGFPSAGTYAEGAAWVASVLARALAYAHGQGVLHRDVKPANVLLTSSDGPQLLDFNLAHSPHGADQAEEALRGGTLPYMAPEQLEAFLDPDRWRDVGQAADTYAVGLLLDEMLTGRRPPTPDPAIPLPRAIREMLDLRTSPRTPARRLNPQVPHALEAILDRCLALDPRDRYPSARALAEDLRRFVEHRPLLLAANPSVRERASNWFRGHKTAMAAIGAALALSTLVAVLVGISLGNAATPKDLVVQGTNLSKEGQIAEARAAYRKALSLDPTYFWATWGLAKLDYDAGHHREALRNFEEATAQIRRQHRTGEQVEALLHSHAGLLLTLDRPDEAAPLFEEALRAYDGPSTHPAHDGLAQIADRREDYATALREIDRAIALVERDRAPDRKLASYRAFRARILTNLGIPLKLDVEGNRRVAREYFLAALEDIAKARDLGVKFTPAEDAELHATEAGAVVRLGDCYSSVDDYRNSMGRYGQARRSLEAALALVPGDAKATRLLAEVRQRIATDGKKL